MHAPWAEWDHVLKVDPDKDLPEGVTVRRAAVRSSEPETFEPRG